MPGLEHSPTHPVPVPILSPPQAKMGAGWCWGLALKGENEEKGECVNRGVEGGRAPPEAGIHSPARGVAPQAVPAGRRQHRSLVVGLAGAGTFLPPKGSRPLGLAADHGQARGGGGVDRAMAQGAFSPVPPVGAQWEQTPKPRGGTPTPVSHSSTKDTPGSLPPSSLRDSLLGELHPQLVDIIVPAWELCSLGLTSPHRALGGEGAAGTGDSRARAVTVTLGEDGPCQGGPSWCADLLPSSRLSRQF